MLVSGGSLRGAALPSLLVIIRLRAPSGDDPGHEQFSLELLKLSLTGCSTKPTRWLGRMPLEGANGRAADSQGSASSAQTTCSSWQRT